MLLLLSSLALSPPATAQDALSIEAAHTGQVDLSAPTFTVIANVSGSVDVSLSCSGRSYSWAGRLSPGGRATLELDGLSRGQHSCQGALSLEADDGSAGEMPLSLQVAMVDPLSLDVDRETLDLDNRRMTIRSSRPLGRIEIAAFGEGGAQIGAGEIGLSGETETMVEWAPQGAPDAEALKIVVTAWDVDGLAGQLFLSPWSYAIPHEDVIFASGQAAIEADEAPKMEQAWSDLEAVLARYGDVVEVRLYVAGYTDTVGAASSNQGLSERRAKAIAAWFRQRGFNGEIYYQGFGESALAVATPDETDEPANRRAVYILAAEAPPVSEALPGASWRGL